jgi:hypothetical protein
MPKLVHDLFRNFVLATDEQLPEDERYLTINPTLVFCFRNVVLATDEQLPEDEPPLPDYYAVLHVTPDASVKDIRRSFR